MSVLDWAQHEADEADTQRWSDEAAALSGESNG